VYATVYATVHASVYVGVYATVHASVYVRRGKGGRGREGGSSCLEYDERES